MGFEYLKSRHIYEPKYFSRISQMKKEFVYTDKRI